MGEGPVAGLILAAGLSRRMGEEKLLLPYQGRPLVAHVAAAAIEGGCQPVVLVYRSEAVARAVDGAQRVRNRQAERGQASSLAVGLGALPSECRAAMILLGDQPGVGSNTVTALLRAWPGCEHPALAAEYEERGWRPPVIVARTLWHELMQLQGDEGARQLFHRRPDFLATLKVAGRAEDIDTPEQYRRLLRE